MKKIVVVWLVMLMVVGGIMNFTSKNNRADSTSAKGNISVEGDITTNTTWIFENGTYIINGNVYVYPNVTLTIEPGTEVIFNGHYTLTVYGNLIAVGKESNKITFLGKEAPVEMLNVGIILVKSCGHSHIEYCIIYGGAFEICLQSSNNIIANNTISNATWDNIQINSHNNTIENNIISNATNGYCIYLKGSNNTVGGNVIKGSKATGVNVIGSFNTVVGNTFLSNHCALSISANTNNNSVRNNLFVDNNHEAISICGSNNTIDGNTISMNSGIKMYAGIGIYYNSTNNTISKNIISNAGWGIELATYYTRNETGVMCPRTPSNNIISQNILFNNSKAIHFRKTHSNIVMNCVISNNEYGLYSFVRAEKNVVSHCNISNNIYGMYITTYPYPSLLEESSDLYSNDSWILCNNFINNSQQAYDNCANFWDNGSQGNYWNDYNGHDKQGDGIGDSPYNISGGNNTDRYPLMKPVNITSPIIITNPIANAGSDRTVNVDTIIIFDARNSTTNIGIVNYTWDFGDGTHGYGNIVSHRYSKPGNYKVTLIVRDAIGNENTTSIMVTVEESRQSFSFPWSATTIFSLIFIGIILGVIILKYKVGIKKEASWCPIPPEPLLKPSTMTLRCPECKMTFSVEVKPKPFKVKCPHCGKEGVIG